MCDERLGARGTDARGSSSTAEAFIALVRLFLCLLMAKRCASSRTRCKRNMASEPRGRIAGNSSPGIHLLESLCKAHDTHRGDPKVVEHGLCGLGLEQCPVDHDQLRRIGEPRAFALL